MDYYCDVVYNIIEIKSKNKHLKSLTHNEFDKCIRTNHTIENPDFFDIDSIFNKYITNHNEKFDLYLVKCDFELGFVNFT